MFIYMIVLVYIASVYKFKNNKYYRKLFLRDDFIYTKTYNEKLVLKTLDESQSSVTTAPITSITPIIWQTYHDKNLIPQDIYENIKKYAPDYKHIIYDDKEAIEFLDIHFNSVVLDTFKNFKQGAHKADLLRYCLLYIYGGIYLDIKTELIEPIDEIFVFKDMIYTCLTTKESKIYQGIIASPPKHPLFLSLIAFMVNISKVGFPYHIFCHDIYYSIKRFIPRIKEGQNISEHLKIYLFTEICTRKSSECYDGLDRYGLCCYAYDKDKAIIKIRRSCFPFNKNI